MQAQRRGQLLDKVALCSLLCTKAGCCMKPPRPCSQDHGQSGLFPSREEGSTRNPDVVGEGPHILCFQVMKYVEHAPQCHFQPGLSPGEQVFSCGREEVSFTSVCGSADKLQNWGLQQERS